MSIGRACPLLPAPPIQVGTWAGNLMLTHSNDNFPSDVYTIMEAVGAKVTIATSATDSKSYSLQDFLSVAMTTSVIVSMEIPFLATNEQLKSFKVMPRAQVSGMCRCRVDRHRSHACTYIRTCMYRCIPVCTHTHTHTHMNRQMHTVLVFLTNRDGFVFGCNHDCVPTLLMFPLYLCTYLPM